MSVNFFTPLINIPFEKKWNNSIIPIINFAENYLNIDTPCYLFSSLKADGKIAVSNSLLPKQHWIGIALKIGSAIFSLGIFPLVMLVIKCLYRAYHPLFIEEVPIKPINISSIPPLNPSSFFKQPKEIIQKIFTDFFSSPNLLTKHTILSKYFNKMVNEDCMKWESLYKEMIKGISKKELDFFIQRAKMLYTQGQDPSFKQKVQYLCEELWEDAKQIPDVQKIIENEKLTIGHLTKNGLYDRFKTLVQTSKDASLVTMAKRLSLASLKGLLHSENFQKQNEGKKANLIREWFDLELSDQELIKITSVDMSSSIILLSTEILAYMARMPHLQSLNLDENKFSFIPKAIGNLNQLQNLTIRDNELSTLPDTIGNLKALKRINLSHNHLSALPDTIGNLRQLKEICLFHNQLLTLPDTIGELNQLQNLKINDNALSSLPDTIGKLSQLSVLYVQENQISDLPDTIGDLSQLRELHINRNQISALPDSIGNCSLLNKLSASDNRLSSLPHTIGNLNQLHVLEIHDNQISDLEMDRIRKQLPNCLGINL